MVVNWKSICCFSWLPTVKKVCVCNEVNFSAIRAFVHRGCKLNTPLKIKSPHMEMFSGFVCVRCSFQQLLPLVLWSFTFSTRVKSNVEDWECVKMRAQSATHTHSLSAAVVDSSITERPLFCWLYFLFLSAGLLPLLRLPWEQDPGPTPPLRPSSSRRWWPLLTVRISLLRYILISITMY